VQEVQLENIVEDDQVTRSTRIIGVKEQVSNGWLDMGPYRSLFNRVFLGYNYQLNRGLAIGARVYYQPQSLLENPPSSLMQEHHNQLLFGIQTKFIIE